MPVRSLRSAVLKWPDESLVVEALAAWAMNLCSRHPEVLSVGYFGSYARGDWGPGSDLDVVVVLHPCDSDSRLTIERESTRSIPVPVDLLVYDEEEFRRLSAGSGRFARVLREECRSVWSAGQP